MDPVAAVGAATGVASLAVATYAVVTQQRQSKAFEAIANSNAQIAHSIESDIKALRTRVDALQQSGSKQADKLALEAAKLEQKRRDAEWKKQKQIWKGIGWALRNLGDDEP